MNTAILEPIPGPNPSGANLRYELIYSEIRSRARRAREQVPHHPDELDVSSPEADWQFVKQACRELLERRSKHLMIAARLTEAQLFADGFPGLRDGFEILRCLLEKFWPTLYPEIEDGDVEARVRVFEWLNKQLATSIKAIFAVDPKTDDLADHRQWNRELDAGIDALKLLEDTCWEKFGDAAPSFHKLALVLEGMRIRPRRWVGLAGIGVSHDVDPEQEFEEFPEEMSPTQADAPSSASVATPPSAPAPAMPSPVPNQEPQKVEFTLTAPAAVAAKVPFELLMWAHESRAVAGAGASARGVERSRSVGAFEGTIQNCQRHDFECQAHDSGCGNR